MTLSLPYIIEGVVIAGEKVGRTIGFPTANLDIPLPLEDLKPGVYAGTCVITSNYNPENPETYHCLPYFGPRYIFGETHNVFEVFIYDFDQTIYGETLEVTLTNFIREPLPLKTLAELQEQLEQDKIAGQAY